jgi:hypothetical protein
MTTLSFDIFFQLDATAARCVSTVRLAADRSATARTRALASEAAG